MKTRLSFLFASVLFVLMSCNPQQPAATTEQPAAPPAPAQEEVNKKAYLEIVNAFNTGNTDSLGKYVTENANDHAEAMGLTSTGLQRLKDIIAMYRASFPDLKMNLHRVVAEGDMVFAHGSWTGTNTGDFMGGKPTGKSINAQFVDIVRFENGKGAEHWGVDESMAFAEQMGMYKPKMASPAPETQPSYDGNTAFVKDTTGKKEKMKDAYRGVLKLIESGDLTGLDQYLAADFNEHAPMPGVDAKGIESARKAMTMFKQAYPDIKVDIHQMVAEGDILMAYYTAEGTYSGAIPGLPASAKGKKASFDGVDIIKFNAEAKATDHWEVADHMKEMRDLGVVPAMGAPEANAAKKK